MKPRESKADQERGQGRAGTPLPATASPGQVSVHGVTRSAFRLGTLLLVALHASLFALGAPTQYAINWSTIDGGGGTSTGGVYAVSGTIGQPDASQQAMTGGNYSVTGGFWALHAVQTPGAPTLTIVPAGLGQATISWSPATGTNWVLQETLNLSPASWTNSPSGSTNPIVVPATLPAKFYRLFKP